MNIPPFMIYNLVCFKYTQIFSYIQISLQILRIVWEHLRYLPPDFSRNSGYQSPINPDVDIAIDVFVVYGFVDFLFISSRSSLQIQKADMHGVLNMHLPVFYHCCPGESGHKLTCALTVISSCYRALDTEQISALLDQNLMYVFLGYHIQSTPRILNMSVQP